MWRSQKMHNFREMPRNGKEPWKNASLPGPAELPSPSVCPTEAPVNNSAKTLKAWKQTFEICFLFGNVFKTETKDVSLMEKNLLDDL